MSCAYPILHCKDFLVSFTLLEILKDGNFNALFVIGSSSVKEMEDRETNTRHLVVSFWAGIEQWQVN